MPKWVNNPLYLNMEYERKRRRCKSCGIRVTLYVFKRNDKWFVKCPKCFSEGPWINKRSKIEIKVKV